MSDFGGVSFIVEADDYSEHRTGRVAIQEIPGGDTFYVDRGGRGPMFVDVTVLLQSLTLLGSLMTQLGQSGSLRVDGRDTHDATLMEVGGPAQQIDGQTKATLKFLVTDV